MKPSTFQNKVCWITGASSGIGASVAISLSKLGAFLILSARSAENLELVRAQCDRPDKVAIVICDMEALHELPDISLKCWNIFNGIDYVFLNAGFAVRDLVINTEMEFFKKLMDINYFSNVMISKTLLPLMKARHGGSFVVTSSLSGRYGVPMLAGYAASKHAVNGFFESLRAENDLYGIKVTIITAGAIKTGITIHALKGNGSPYAKMEESIAHGISANNCATEILQAVANRKNEALVGGLDKYSVWIKRFFPAFWDFAIRNHPLKKLRSLGFVRKELGLLKEIHCL